MDLNLFLLLTFITFTCLSNFWIKMVLCILLYCNLLLCVFVIYVYCYLL